MAHRCAALPHHAGVGHGAAGARPDRGGGGARHGHRPCHAGMGGAGAAGGLPAVPRARAGVPPDPVSHAQGGSMTSLAMNLLERDLVPDFLIRRRIRSLLASRLREEDQGDPERQQQRLSEFLRRLAASPVAIETRAANEQHYEVPTGFYQKVLGKHLKYSSCYFDDSAAPPEVNLDAAEARMLALTCERARLADGDR